MELEGVVTNVTAFGAFVDVGVHQDGLVHVSQLADRFVKDPSDVVKVGDKLKVRVLEVDLQRHRIALTARRENAPARAGTGSPQQAGPVAPPGQGNRPQGGQGPRPTAGPGRRDNPRDGKGPLSHNPFADRFRR